MTPLHLNLKIPEPNMLSSYSTSLKTSEPIFTRKLKSNYMRQWDSNSALKCLGEILLWYVSIWI